MGQNIFAYFWQAESPYVLLMAAVLAFVLLRTRPADRASLLYTIGLFMVSLGGQFGSGIVHALGFVAAAGVLREIFLIAGGVAVIRLWGLLIFRVLLPLVHLHPARIVEDILILLAYIAWGLLRLRYAGMDLSGIVTTSAVITAVAAFAMQDTLGNVLGGVALQLDKSVQIGDWIKVDDLVGRVTDIRWRSTCIETRNWETVVIPNSVLMKSKFSVLGRRAGEPLQWRRWVWFNVDLATAPARVVSTVEGAVHEAEIAGVAKQPLPNCALMEFENGYARYALRYWLTDLYNDDPTDSTVRNHVLTALQRAGIRLAVPEHNIHLIKEDEKHKEAVQAREYTRRLAALKHADLFSTFREDELRTVAERLMYAPFARGDIITRQGNVAHWLYIMISGEAEVVLEAPGQARRVLSVLPAGCFFGEMGLMTGAPRTATVVARSHVECYRLDKASFEDIMRSRPTLAEEMAQIIVARRDGLDSAQRESDAAAPMAGVAVRHNELLGRIRRFFGLGAV